MCQLFLFQSSFIQKLQKYDEDTMLAAKERGCPHCAGVLDRADYRRKPRCPLDALPEGFSVRYSLCCREDGCRRRLTPRSIRFFGRRVYWSVAILLISAQLLFQSQIENRTVRRWKTFWDKGFLDSAEWRRARGAILMMDQAAGSLMGVLSASSPQSHQSLIRLLHLITPCWAK